MKTREKFKRRVIELIHGLPYEEAIEKESENDNCLFTSGMEEPFTSTKENKNLIIPAYKKGEFQELFTPLGLPITIGRVIQAWANLKSDGKNLICEIYEECSFSKGVYTEVAEIIDMWELTKENGSECTDDDQSDEAIEQIYNLLK